MARKNVKPEDGSWKIPDALLERIRLLLPSSPPHLLGCHNPAAEPRKTMDAIFLFKYINRAVFPTSPNF